MWGTHPAHGGLQHPQEQQSPLHAQPGLEDFLCAVRLQEPLQLGVQAVLEEEAGCRDACQGPVWEGRTANPWAAAAGGISATPCMRETRMFKKVLKTPPATCAELSSSSLTTNTVQLRSLIVCNETVRAPAQGKARILASRPDSTSLTGLSQLFWLLHLSFPLCEIKIALSAPWGCHKCQVRQMCEMSPMAPATRQRLFPGHILER